MEYQYYIKNLEGVLYYIDTPVVEFKIRKRELIHFKELSNGRYYPTEFDYLGISYGGLNKFFEDRVVKYGTQDIASYLKAMNLKEYDFEQLIKKNNGWNHLDNYWLKMKDIGAYDWNEITSQSYPIY